MAEIDWDEVSARVERKTHVKILPEELKEDLEWQADNAWEVTLNPPPGTHGHIAPEHEYKTSFIHEFAKAGHEEDLVRIHRQHQEEIQASVGPDPEPDLEVVRQYANRKNWAGIARRIKREKGVEITPQQLESDAIWIAEDRRKPIPGEAEIESRYSRRHPTEIMKGVIDSLTNTKSPDIESLLQGHWAHYKEIHGIDWMKIASHGPRIDWTEVSVRVRNATGAKISPEELKKDVEWRVVQYLEGEMQRGERDRVKGLYFTQDWFNNTISSYLEKGGEGYLLQIHKDHQKELQEKAKHQVHALFLPPNLPGGVDVTEHSGPIARGNPRDPTQLG